MKKTLIGIGEILWDFLPAGKVMGGAPANFVNHVNNLGEKGVVVSCIGRDELGKEIIISLDELGLKYDRCSFPGEKGKKRMTAKTLTKQDPKGKYIIRVAGHVAAVCESTLLDTWDCSDKCIYFAWKIY